MASLPDERRAVFTDAYRFYEAHWDMPDTAEAWKACAEEMGKLSSKHGDTDLAKRLFLALYSAIDDENREMRRALNG